MYELKENKTFVVLEGTKVIVPILEANISVSQFTVGIL